MSFSLRITNFDQALVPLVKSFCLSNLSEPKHYNIKVVVKENTLLIFSFNFKIVAVSTEVPLLLTHKFKYFDFLERYDNIWLLGKLLLRFVTNKQTFDWIEV